MPDEPLQAIRSSSRPKGTVRAGPLNRTIRVITWVYLTVLMTLWAALRFWGDDWWLATVVLFGPLYVTMWPLALLIPGAVLFCRRALAPLAVAAWVAVFGLAGLCIPWRTWLHFRHGHEHLRLITCNINGRHSLNPIALEQLVREEQPDVVVLQEWPHLQLPSLAFAAPGWFTRQDGELFIASRFPITHAAAYRDPHWAHLGGAADLYDLLSKDGTIHLFNLHLASPHNSFEQIIDDGAAGSSALEHHIAARSQQSLIFSTAAAKVGDDVILAGDFNTPCEGEIYNEYWSNFNDAFTVAGFGLGLTYLAHGAEVRIDHIFSGSAWRCTSCEVGPFVGSPHRPVIADLER